MFEKIQKFIRNILQQEYLKASVYYIIANIIGQGVVLLSSAVFTRMMSKTDYGLVSTYSTWVLVLNTFVCLNLFISVRTAYIDFKEDYDNYNSSILALNILCGIGMTVVIAGITRIFSNSFGIAEVVFACIQSVALNIINFMLAIQSMKNEYRQRTFMLIAPNWTHTLLSIILMLSFTGSLYILKIAGNAIGLVIYGIACSIVLFYKAKPKIIPKYWKYSLKISVPSIFYTLSDLILMQCDRLMLTSMIGATVTAEYSVIYNVSSIIVAIYQAAGGAWIPWFFNKVKNNDYKVIKVYQGYYIMFFSILSCGIMTISPELIKILSPRNYWAGIDYVAPLMIASYFMFLYAFFATYLLYLKRTMRIAVNTIIAALLNLVLNFILIPQYAAKGAVVATVISYVVLFILHLIAVRKDYKRYFPVRVMFLNVIGVTMFGLVFYYVRNICIIRYLIYGGVVTSFYLLYGRKIITELTQKVNV